MDPDRLANVTAVTHGYVDSGRFPNAVTAVLHRGEEVLRDVYGWADIAGRAADRARTRSSASSR